jgi:hypothetical protein
VTAAGEIRFGDGITISFSAAADLVGVIGLAEKLLARTNGQPLPDRAFVMRDSLRNCLLLAGTYASTDANVSAETVLSESGLAFELSPSAAASALGISTSAVRFACRSGHLGRKVGGRWVITDREIEVTE